MLKVMDTGFATDHVAPATILSGSFEETHQAPQPAPCETGSNDAMN
jgi:hypothetical protein